MRRLHLAFSLRLCLRSNADYHFRVAAIRIQAGRVRLSPNRSQDDAGGFSDRPGGGTRRRRHESVTGQLRVVGSPLTDFTSVELR
ncbi:hypothetical protein QBC47DRAFT_377963 [Echria macrotheca]|uniref:Uncharacterized protein n=1 Tax=Echria macrotheca TaxID=438768 RepID=A0AAJ0FCU6_9PEZI|nr:hypothetical protein QBC47DRAFT_377963 [Echria macrotheca]